MNVPLPCLRLVVFWAGLVLAGCSPLLPPPEIGQRPDPDPIAELIAASEQAASAPAPTPAPAESATSPAQRGPTPEPAAGTWPGERIVEIARKFLGAPYARGGSGPQGFDCSGLVQFVHQQVGISVPRTSAEQHRQARAVETGKLLPGDLVFFRLRSQRVSHVGIY